MYKNIKFWNVKKGLSALLHKVKDVSGLIAT